MITGLSVSLLIIILLLSVLYIVIQLPSVQNWGTKKATNYFQTEWNVEVNIESFRLSFKDLLIIENIYIEDQHDRKLLSAEELRVDFNKNLLHVLFGKLSVENIALRSPHIHIIKSEDVYNFDFIIQHFRSDKARNNESVIELDIDRILLEDAIFELDNQDEASKLESAVSLANIEITGLDLQSMLIEIGHLELYESEISLTLQSQDAVDHSKEIVIPNEKEKRTEPKILVDVLKINNGRFKLDNYRRSQERSRPDDALDFDFLDVHNIFFHIEDIDFKPIDITANICHLSFNTSSGFELQTLQSENFSLDNEELVLDKLILKTPESYIKDRLVFQYESLRDFQEYVDYVYMNFDLRDSYLATTDLFYFAPELRDNPFFIKNRDNKVYFSGKVNGTVNSLKGYALDVQLSEKVRFRGDYASKSLTTPDESILNLRIESLQSDIKNLRLLLPGFDLPDHFDRLGKLEFKGRFDGYYHDFVTYGTLQSELGEAITDIQLNSELGYDNAKYNGSLELIKFDLNKWLESDDFGYLSMKANVERGYGLILDNIEAYVNANVTAFEYKDYLYKDFIFQGQLVKNLMNGKLLINDENINLNFDGQINFQEENPILNFQADINLLDLYKLNFTNNPLALSGSFDMDIEYKNISNIDGTAEIHDLVLYVESGEFIYVDSIEVESRYKDREQKFIQLTSDMAEISLEGQFNLDNIYPTLMYSLQKKQPRLYNMFNLPKPKTNIESNNFKFNINVNDTKNLTDILNLPLERVTDLRVNGDFYNKDTSLVYYQIRQFTVPKLTFRDVSLNNLTMWSESQSVGTEMIGHMDNISFNGVPLENIDFRLNLDKDTVNIDMGASTLLNAFDQLNINARLFAVEDKLHLTFDNFGFNSLNKFWTIQDRNFIQFKKDYLYARRIKFSDGEGFVSLSTHNDKGAMISGNEINLEMFNTLLQERDIVLKGVSSFQFSVDDYSKVSNLRGSGFIRNLHFNSLSLGNARLLATQDDLRSATLLDLNIGEPGRDLKGRGFIKLPNVKLEEGDYRYSFDFYMNEFPLSPAEYFLSGLISETSGVFSGDFYVEGDSIIQNVGGDLNLIRASTKIDYLGTKYTVQNSRVFITNEYINLNEVVLEDTRGRTANMQGRIWHDKLRNMVTDFRIVSPSFMVLNTRSKDNDLYYGRASGRINVTFEGPFDALDIYVNATTGPNTVVAIPLTEAKEIKEQNFIVFVSKDDDNDGSNVVTAPDGLSLRMDLSITPDAELQLIFDERTGEIIKGTGNGNIQLDLPRNGDFQMFGEFLIDRGEYPFKMPFLEKSFNVKEGGTIVWYGDPLDAIINLEAEYKGLKTSPFNFISEFFRNQTNEELLQEARRPTDVDLTLALDGPLLQPNIQFDIQFPQLTGELRNYTDTKLRTLSTDLNELNNIAFQLLFFKGFIPNQTEIVSAQGGLGIASSTLTELFTNQMRVFVNEFLIDTVNNTIVTDVDFDFGIIINTDYSQDLQNLVAAGQSQFYIRPRVQMFDDKVTFDFGINNYGRLGADNRLAGEFNLEYAFGDSRRFRAKVYSQDQPLPDSRRTVFGAGIIYRREYDEFRDIFRFNSRRRKRDKAPPSLPDYPEFQPNLSPLLEEDNAIEEK